MLCKLTYLIIKRNILIYTYKIYNIFGARKLKKAKINKRIIILEEKNKYVKFFFFKLV